MDDINDIKTQLLTLLNVSASKRQKYVNEETPVEPNPKKKSRKTATPPPEAPQPSTAEQPVRDDEDEVHSDHEQDCTCFYLNKP